MAMAAPPPPVTWIPEDDILLKNAVESGASLEALAKGAVQFSRKFTLKELQDRWYALLYDPVVSAEAATRMFELELSGFSASLKNSKNDHSKGNKEVPQKRKRGSIRKQYNAMRKKFRSEFFNPADLGFLDEPILPDVGGDPQNGNGVLGNPVPNHLEFFEPEIETINAAFPKPGGDTAAVDKHSIYLAGCSNKHQVKHPKGVLSKYGSSENVSLNQKQSGIHESGIPQSLEMHRLSVFDSRKDNPQNVIRGSRQEHHLSPSRGVAFSSEEPTQPSTDTVQGADDNGNGLPDSLLNLSNEDGILLADVDGKVTSEKSLSVAPEDGTGNLEPEKLKAPESCLANLGHEKPDATTSSFHCENIPNAEDCELLDTTLAFDYHDLGIDDVNVFCTLNVEDPDIPCNDDIFLLIHPNSSRGDSTSQPSRGVQVGFSSAGQKKVNPGKALIMDIKDVSKSSNWPQKTGPNILPETPKFVLSKAVKRTPSGSSHANASISASGKPGDGVLRLDSKVGEASVALPGEQINPELMLNLSDLEDSESDDEVPCFSDVEAMILEMDLDPYEDTQRTKLAPKYQTEEAKRNIIRMEQCVQSSIQRALTSLGAFAVFYGRHLKHYIKKTEVTIGRSTDDVSVDIDLRKEGRANKISRLQAIVKMEANGSFYLKNLGKSVISVNGKAVAKGQLICLSLSCLIEIRGMSFIFETNPKLIKQYMAAHQKSQGKSPII